MLVLEFLKSLDILFLRLLLRQTGLDNLLPCSVLVLSLLCGVSSRVLESRLMVEWEGLAKSRMVGGVCTWKSKEPGFFASAKSAPLATLAQP